MEYRLGGGDFDWKYRLGGGKYWEYRLGGGELDWWFVYMWEFFSGYELVVGCYGFERFPVELSVALHAAFDLQAAVDVLGPVPGYEGCSFEIPHFMVLRRALRSLNPAPMYPTDTRELDHMVVLAFLRLHGNAVLNSTSQLFVYAQTTQLVQ